MAKKSFAIEIRGDIRRLRLKPGDVVVLSVRDDLATADELSTISETVRNILSEAGLSNGIIASNGKVQVSMLSPE